MSRVSHVTSIPPPSRIKTDPTPLICLHLGSLRSVSFSTHSAQNIYSTKRSVFLVYSFPLLCTRPFLLYSYPNHKLLLFYSNLVINNQFSTSQRNTLRFLKRGIRYPEYSGISYHYSLNVKSFFKAAVTPKIKTLTFDLRTLPDLTLLVVILPS